MIKSYAQLKEENEELRKELRKRIQREINLERVINEYNDIFNKNKIILARYIELTEKEQKNAI